jgi:hypothetical protein
MSVRFTEFLKKLALNEEKFLTGKVINVPDGKMLNIRSSPESQNSLVGKLSPNEEFYFLDEKKIFDEVEFIKINFDSKVGWIASNFAQYTDRNGSLIKGKLDEPDTQKYNAPKEEWMLYAPRNIKRISESYGIPESVAFAQFALESNYGKNNIGGFNFFGIKGVGNDGSTSVKTVEEFVPGKKVTINDSFKKYKTVEDGFDSYAALLANNKRFSEAIMSYSKSPGKFIIWIWANGYATDSSYPQKISNVSKTIGRKLGRQDLVINFSSEEESLINHLSSLPPEQRRSKIRSIKDKANSGV